MPLVRPAVMAAPAPNDKELAELIEKLGKSISKNSRSPRILIFPSPFSEQVAAGLVRNHSAFKIVSQSEMRKAFDESGLTVESLASPHAVAWLAKTLGAEIVITHSITIGRDTVNVKMGALAVGNRKKLADVETKLARSPELVDQLKRWQSPLNTERATAPPAPSANAEVGVLQAGKDGVGIPKCVYCPNPTFTDAAVDAGFSGVVVLRVIVTEAGQVINLTPLKRAPYGLTDRAIETVQTWKLEPAKKDGKPVAVMMLVEVVFKHYR